MLPLTGIAISICAESFASSATDTSPDRIVEIPRKRRILSRCARRLIISSVCRHYTVCSELIRLLGTAFGVDFCLALGIPKQRDHADRFCRCHNRTRIPRGTASRQLAPQSSAVRSMLVPLANRHSSCCEPTNHAFALRGRSTAQNRIYMMSAARITNQKIKRWLEMMVATPPIGNLVALTGSRPRPLHFFSGHSKSQPSRWLAMGHFIYTG